MLEFDHEEILITFFVYSNHLVVAKLVRTIQKKI